MAKERTKWEKKLDQYYLGFLRKVFRWSPAYKSVLAKAQVKKGKKLFYRCAECNELKERKDKAVDHILAMVPTNDSWANHAYSWTWIKERIGFQNPENLQVLCREDHAKKTKRETAERSVFRRTAKNS